jgi:hypothetical protein
MTKHSSNTHVAPHWTWHILIAAAVLLLGTATLLYQLPPSHQPLSPARQHLAMVLCIMAGFACLIPWALRRMLSRDWRSAWARQAPHAAPPASSLISTVSPQWAERSLWLTLVLWGAWVTWSMTINDRLAAHLTLENGLLQDLTVLCYAAAALLLFSLTWPAFRPKARSNLRRWWLLVLAFGCLGVAGEETNWGQSVVEYETPEFLAHTNIQQEVSLHNIELPGLPGRHWSNDVLWGISLLGGVAIPISLLASVRIRRLTWLTEVPVPPWVSQGYFLAAAMIPRDGVMLGRLSRDNIPSELREVTIAVAMLIWAWSLRKQHHATQADPRDHTRQGGERDEIQTPRA